MTDLWIKAVYLGSQYHVLCLIDSNRMLESPYFFNEFGVLVELNSQLLVGSSPAEGIKKLILLSKQSIFQCNILVHKM